jgi:predicted metal-dependent HD superfamily phosphohydrolase
MKINKLKEFISQKLRNELSDKLTYHGLHHTLLVLKVCNEYIERMKISDSDARLLQTAAIMHDTGFIWDNENHEERSILYAKEILPDWEYSDEEIEKIASLILATKIPQKPTNILEQIIGDSDLDYLGTDLFYEEGEKLYQELLAFNKISTREEWDKLQVKFLENHTYHTPFAKVNREPVKQKHLQEIMDKYSW